VTLSAGEDFIGYETAFYGVHPRKGGGVRLEFTSAEVTKEGEKTLQSHPQVQLFRLPRKAKFVRLFYLKRLSQADHNMAVVASNKMDVLEMCTSDIQRNPADACDGKRDCFCTWVPPGIAVRPEVPTDGDGVESWAPAPVQE
jgi:hypothetical protein